MNKKKWLRVSQT